MFESIRGICIGTMAVCRSILAEIFFLQLEDGHQLELEQVDSVQAVYAFLGGCIFAHAGADVTVENGIGEAQVVLVGLAAQAIDGNFLHQFPGQSQQIADLLDLLYRQAGHGRKIASRITVTGGISHPIFR